MTATTPTITNTRRPDVTRPLVPARSCATRPGGSHQQRITMTLEEARQHVAAGLERSVQAFEAGAPAQGFTAEQIAATAAAMRLDNSASLNRYARAWMLTEAAR